MGYVNGLDVHRVLVSLTDLLSSEPDPAHRLKLTLDALKEAQEALRRLRNEAAYESRVQYRLHALEAATGVNHGILSDWSKAHARRNGLPAIRHDSRITQAWDATATPPERREFR